MQPAKWRTILQKTGSDPQAALEELDVAETAAWSAEAAASFPYKATRPFLDRIRPGDPHDPLLLQVLPAAAENDHVPGYGLDPLQEKDCQPVPGVLRKYRERALLIVTGACAIHCRYCFRRHFPYADATAATSRWREALAYLQQDTGIREIILSGGDPLMIVNDKLRFLVENLSGIAHLERLRVHTRMPVVLPERVDEGLVSLLTDTRLQRIVVVHANHPQELDEGVAAAVAKLRAARILIMNQSVLLKNINDNATVLRELSEKLFSIGILPYYLHMLDPVQGAAHFEVPEERAMNIMEELRTMLPGYLVPRLVRELPGRAHKILVT